MNKIIKKGLFILSIKERQEGVKVLFLAAVLSIVEVIGVASVMPFLSILGNQNLIMANKSLAQLYDLSGVFGIENKYDFTVLIGVLTFIITIFTALLRIYTHIQISLIVEKKRQSIGLRLLTEYTKREYRFFTSRNKVELAKNVLSEVDLYVENFIRPSLKGATSIITLAAIILFLIILNKEIAFFATLVFGLTYVLLFKLVRSRVTKLGATMRKSNTERFKATDEILGGIKEIKILGNESTYLKKMEQTSLRFAMSKAKHQVISQTPKYIVEGVAFGALILLALVLLLKNDNSSANTIGEALPILGVYLFSAYRMQPAMQQIFHGIVSIKFSEKIIDNLSNDFEQAKFNERNRHPIQRELRIKRDLELRNITFGYPGRQIGVLNDVNISIKQGETIGIIGETGAGKSTLVDIILGLQKLEIGEIYIDGTILNDENMRSYQDQIGYVPQEIFMVDDTIAQNVALGEEEKIVNHERIREAGKIAQIDQFIESELPEKYHTVVGDRAVRLSGGQKQRIGIARALYRKPSILILDEATSALDSKTQRNIIRAIKCLRYPITVIMITHRKSTLNYCDKTYHLEGQKLSRIE